jgi:methyl-accepting chemotaxis protein-1 (serine sensor receptor)
LIGSVAVASAEQSGGVQSVTQALPQLESVTQESASLMASGLQATQELEQTSARLVAVTQAFRLPDPNAREIDVRRSFHSLTLNLQLNRWLAMFVYVPVIVSVSIPSVIGALLFGLLALGGIATTFIGALSALEAPSAFVAEPLQWGLFAITAIAFAVGAGLFFALSMYQVIGAAFVQRAVKRIAVGDFSWEVQVFGTEATSGHLEAYGMTKALFDLKQHFISVVREVRSGADAVSSNAHDIAKGYDKLAEHTQSLAAAFEEASVSVEELQATAAQNADNCQAAQSAAEEVRERAERTAQSMRKVTVTMAGIEQSAAEMKEFIGVIESIAFQTNILALNAAVEAGRAGEQGRGFAVVAAEVRTLAQRSARATEEVKELIAESVQYVAQGSTLVKEAEQTLHRVVTGVREIVGVIDAIAKVSVEQTGGMQQISHALLELEQVAQQNAALVEEGAAAAVSFDHEGADLSQSVGIFRLDKSAPKRAR